MYRLSSVSPFNIAVHNSIFYQLRRLLFSSKIYWIVFGTYYSIRQSNTRILHSPPSEYSGSMQLLHEGGNSRNSLIISYLPRHKPLLALCTRPGGFLTSRSFSRKRVKTRWFAGQLNYFSQMSNLHKGCGGIPVREPGFQLFCAANVTVKIGSYDSNSLTRNAFSISSEFKSESEKLDFTTGFLFDIQGSESFQHFMIDALPALADSHTFLSQNSEIPIILRKPNKAFNNPEFILKDLKLANRIFYVDSGAILNFRRLFWHEYDSGDLVGSSPLDSYQKASSLLNKSKLDSNRVTLIVRSSQYRKWANLDKITLFLSDFLTSHSFSLRTLNSELVSNVEKSTAFASSKIVIAIHGGDNYHSIYMHPSSTLLEIIPTIETETCLRFAAGSGAGYALLPVVAKKSDHLFNVPQSDLHDLLQAVIRAQNHGISLLGREQ